MIVLTEQQAAQLLWKNQFRHSVLRPLRLTDGRYALPESVLTAPEHARWRALLSQGTIVAAGSLTFDTTDPDDFYFTTPSGVMMSLYTGGALPATFGPTRKRSPTAILPVSFTDQPLTAMAVPVDEL